MERSADGPVAAPGRRIPARVWDAAEEARARLGRAAAEAAALLEGARVEAAALRVEAAAAGREEGLARATAHLVRAALERDRLLAAAEPELLELAFDIAGRVLARAVERDREAVVEVAGRALQAVRQRTDLRLRAHPDDLAALREAEPRLVEGLARARRVGLVADAAVARGGVVVESEAGEVDARLGTQLAALRELVLGDRP